MKTNRYREWAKSGAYAAVQEHPTFEDIRELRKQIVLNSLFVSDYENSFDFDAYEVCDFFDGYMDFLDEEYKEVQGKPAKDPQDVLMFESDENLLSWMMIWEAGCGGTFTKYVEVEDEYEEDVR